MKKSILVLIIIVVFGALIYYFLKSQPEKKSELKVAATIPPLADIVRNVAGDSIEVIQILKAGASPHTFEATPSQILELQGVKTIFAIGHGLDDWASQLVDAKVVVVDQGIQLKDGEGDGQDPHYWLSMSNAQIIAQTVAKELARLDPDNRDVYFDNAGNYALSLIKTQKKLEGKVNELDNKNLVVFHDSWYYFAEEFGFNIVGVFEPAPGKEPTAQDLAELQRLVRENDIKALFAEPQLSKKSLEPFANDTGLQIFTLDPLGGVEGRKTYLELIEYNVDTLVNALR